MLTPLFGFDEATVNVRGIGVKFAVTLRFEFIVTVHIFPEVESAPVQLWNVNPVFAIAVSVATVPGLYVPPLPILFAAASIRILGFTIPLRPSVTDNPVVVNADST